MPIGLNEGNIGRSVCPGFGKILRANAEWKTRDLWIQFSFVQTQQMRTVTPRSTFAHYKYRFFFSWRPDHWASARDMYYCAYSMKTSNNFQNVLPTSFELLHIISTDFFFRDALITGPVHGTCITVCTVWKPRITSKMYYLPVSNFCTL